MIRHILLLNWTEGLGTAEIDEAVRIVESVRSLRWIRNLSYGHGLGLAADGYDFVAVMDFASADDWHAYDRDPAHQQAAASLRRFVSQKARIQLELPA